jgi:uncharacterized short protein YbdD (DUF466 family)
MVGVNKYSKMVHHMKGNGKMICHMEGEFLYKKMEVNIKGSLRMKNVGGMVGMFLGMGLLSMKDSFKMICSMVLGLKPK